MNTNNIVPGQVILKSISPSQCKCNQITDLTLLIISITGFVFGISGSVIYDPLLGSGYIGTGIFAGVSLYSIKKMRLRETIADSVNVLTEENDELKQNNDKLEENIIDLNENNKKLTKDIFKLTKNINTLEVDLSKLTKNTKELENVKISLNDDIKILKNTVGLIGENSDELFIKLKEIYNNLNLENNRHSTLIKSQTSLLLMNIINHYDKNSNFELDLNEINYAKQSILNILPNVTWKQIENKIQNNQLKLESILELIE